MGFGYFGKILKVDLASGVISIDTHDDLFYRTYVGGWGIVAYYLFKEVPRGADPLGPDNLLIFTRGIATGAAAGGSGRSVVGAKSPLTGGFGAAEVGGYWGAELTKAGYDAIVIQGQSEKPVFLVIDDDKVEIRPAEHLWGLLTAPAQAAIQTDLGPEGKHFRVAQIGPAGEGLSLIASIMHDINRAAGRTGLGAVMGSKRLKAVAVHGTHKLPVADPQAVADIARGYAKNYPNTWAVDLHDQGTAGGVASSLIGGLPTHNFQEGSFDAWELISGTTMRDTILKDRATCFACPVVCKRVVEIKAGPYPVDPVYGGPEFETIGAFGSCCGVADLAAVACCNQLCNAYGLDTISTGVTVAWAMECFSRGLITRQDTGGIELSFGNVEALVEIVGQIGRREGFGALLGQGAYRAAQQIGRGTQELVMHVKGQPIPLHEPRIKFGFGIGYAVSPTGADHMHNFHDVDYDTADKIAVLRPFGILEPRPFNDLGPEKMRMLAVEIPWQTLNNALGFCMFVSGTYDRFKFVELVHAITGWDTSLLELEKAGERVYTMARAFNAREGLDAAQDRLPERFFERFKAGPSANNHIDPEIFNQALITFYQMMGYDTCTGAPLPWKLHELGVGWIANVLYPAV